MHDIKQVSHEFIGSAKGRMAPRHDSVPLCTKPGKTEELTQTGRRDSKAPTIFRGSVYINRRECQSEFAN